MKKLFIILGLLLSFCSCHEVEDDCLTLKASLEEQEVSATDVFSAFEVIPLETNDSCLLIWPDKVLYREGNYEVFDIKHPALFVFDKDGRFLRKVGEKSDGPEGYTEVYDALHDGRNGNICMLSPFGEMFVYGADGGFLNRIRLPQKINYHSFEDLGDFFVTWTLPGDKGDNGISFISKETMLCVKEYWEGNRNLYFLYPRAFHKYENKLYFFRPFGREVYHVAENDMSIAYR